MKGSTKVLLFVCVPVGIVAAIAIAVVMFRESPEPPPIGAVIFVSFFLGFGIAMICFLAICRFIAYGHIAETVIRAGHKMPILNAPADDEDDEVEID